MTAVHGFFDTATAVTSTGDVIAFGGEGPLDTTAWDDQAAFWDSEAAVWFGEPEAIIYAAGPGAAPSLARPRRSRRGRRGHVVVPRSLIDQSVDQVSRGTPGMKALLSSPPILRRNAPNPALTALRARERAEEARAKRQRKDEEESITRLLQALFSEDFF